MELNLKDICLKTCEVAKMAGQFIAQERTRFDSSRIEFKGIHDLVSYVDKQAEQLIVHELRQLVPEAGFIAEEGTVITQGEDYQWIIDPLDGTTNFIQGIPVFAVSIGLACKGEVLLGVVFEVGQQECFYAWKGGGAYLDDTPVQVTDHSDLHQCLLATGFPYTEFWEYDLKPWDVAAGALLVQEAGGVVTDFRGENNYIFGRTIMASNKRVKDELLRKLNEYMG